VNLRDPIMSAMHAEFGVHIHHSQWCSFDLSVHYGVAQDEILAAFLKHGVLEAASFEPHAQEAFQAVRDAGCSVKILTARGWHARADEITRASLAEAGLVPDEILIVPLHSSKDAALRQCGPVAAYLDDHAGHIQDATHCANVERPVLMDRPWNRDSTHPHRVASLLEFITRFVNV